MAIPVLSRNARVSGGVSVVATTNNLAIDANEITQANVTAQQSPLTILNPTGSPHPSQKLVVRIRDNGNARSLSWGSDFRTLGAALPTTTVANKLLYVGFIWNSTDARWDCMATAQEP